MVAPCPARAAIASLPVLESIVHSIYLVLYPGVFVLVYGQSNPNQNLDEVNHMLGLQSYNNPNIIKPVIPPNVCVSAFIPIVMAQCH